MSGDLPMVPQEDLEAIDPYEFHTRMEPHLNQTPIAVDEETGFRYTYRDIGMTRNASNTKEMKVFLDPIPHVVLDQSIPLRGWYKSKVEPPNVRPRPCDTDSILSQPYGGFCAVGCGFCYINNGNRGYRGQGVTTVDPNYAEKCRKQLARMNISWAIYMSSFIDPFLELEEHYHNTEGLARAAVDVDLPIYFLTRKTVPGWAYDLLKKNKYSYMQFSINTSDPEDWRRLSPRAIPLLDNFEQVREMKRQGIYVSIQVNPIVAGITSNEDIVKLIHILAECGADHLIFKFVEIVYPSAPGMIANMRSRFGDRANSFEKLFIQNIGGVKTIEEGYRKAALDIFSVECKKAGVTMSLCYEYEYERDADGKILSKVGVSMGERYRTSEQCHGHRVPAHIRSGNKFVPFEACPPAGCLTCGDKHKTVPCGDPELGKAKALQPSDLVRGMRPVGVIDVGGAVPLT